MYLISQIFLWRKIKRKSVNDKILTIMGYYTYHTLEVFDEKMNYLEDETQKHATLISNRVFGKDDPDFKDNEFPLLFSDSSKWYDCEQDMRKYSKEYPNLIFKIHGDGEESNDLWDMYAKNGKIQLCPGEVIYDNFDKSKLK